MTTTVEGGSVRPAPDSRRPSQPSGKRKRSGPRSYFRLLTLGALCLLMLVPIYYLMYLSFSQPGSEFNFPPSVIPQDASIRNIIDAPVAGTTPLWGYAKNSLFYAVAATLGCLIAETITGYALARLRFPGRSIIFGLTIAMMMLPFVVTMIPRFLMFNQLGLTDSLWPLIIPWWFGGAPYGIFLMRQFFMTIPLEIDEAARVDGAGPWRTLWLILVPQAIPIMVSLGMLHLAFFWNDLLGPVIYCQSQSCMTLPQGILFNYKSNWDPQWALFMMSSLLMILPIALLFLIMQRRYKQAFLFSGLGGR